MTSKYFEIKTNSDVFKNHIYNVIDNLKGKKVLLYGVGKAFFELDKLYHLRNKLNFIATADKKFEKDNSDITGLKQIIPDNIMNENYDYILVTNEKPRRVLLFLKDVLNIPADKIVQLFEEEIKDEGINLEYLYKYKFDKTLPKLVKELKDKTVILYGAGVFLELINNYFDLSSLNIIGIADKRYDGTETEEQFLGYKTYSPKQIAKLNPDYVIVCTKFYIGIIYDLYYHTLKNTNIKIKPLLKKDFFALLREVWS